MSKKVYIGVNGIAQEAKNIYVGVEGVAKKVVKGYVGVDGTPMLFYEKSEDDRNIDFWFYYETKANVDDISIHVRNYKKTLNGIAFYASFGGWYPNSRIWSPLFVSTDIDAVSYTWFGADASVTYKGTFEVNGDTWYWAAWGGLVLKGSYTHNPPYLLGDGYDSTVDQAAPAKDLVNRIYANDFAEDYQIGQAYNLRLGNIEKTIRKAIAVFLFKSIYLKTSTHYNVLLENVDNFVNDLLTYAGDSKTVEFRIFRGYGDIIQLTAFYSSDVPDNKSITNYRGAYYYFYYTYNSAIQADKGYRMIQIANDGTITKSGSSSNAGNMSNYIGLYLNKGTTAGITYTTVYLSNLGLNL